MSFQLTVFRQLHPAFAGVSDAAVTVAAGQAASMTAIAIIVAALLLGHDISKAIDRLTDAIERNKQENQK